MFILVGLQENTHTMIEKTNQLKTAHCAVSHIINLLHNHSQQLAL